MLGDGSQWNEPHAIREALGKVGGDFKSQPGLPHTGSARERHQPYVFALQEGRESGKLSIAPDEIGSLGREVACALDGTGDLRRRGKIVVNGLCLRARLYIKLAPQGILTLAEDASSCGAITHSNEKPHQPPV